MAATFFILLHWKRQQRIFLQNLAKLKGQQEAKAIHDIRVATKKLRSYLKLMTVLLKDDKETAFEKTEQMFSVLGKHRDIEMGLLLLQSLEKENRMAYPVFRRQLKVALQTTEIWVQNSLNKYDEKELADLTSELQQDLKEKNNQELLDKTGAVLNKEFKKLKGLAKHFNNHPHVVRKMLKNIFYWISISPKDLLLNSSQVRKLRKSLGYLGDWQDHEMLYQKIKHFRKDFVPDSREEYLLLKELEKNIESKMEAKFQKAEESVQGFISL